GPAPRADVGQEDAHLAVGLLAEGTAILTGDAHRLLPLLGETALIDDPHGVRMRQARRQHLLEAPGDGLVVPPGFGQEALQHAGRRAFDRFGEVLGIAPLGGLDEEAPQVVPAALAPLLATERRGEGGMKLTKGFLDACEFLQIHGIAPGAASAPRSYLI